MKKINFYLASIAFLGLVFLSSCEKDKNTVASADQTIAEYAQSDDNFSILVQALAKANLADVLNGSGNFTVFAPTNDAFNALFSQLGVSGINDLSAETLTPILLYHVLGQEKKSTTLATGYYATLSPAQGNFSSLYVVSENGVMLNKNTKVVQADVDVKNGVIHVIDKVLLPPTVVDLAASNDKFSILVQAVVKAGLAETLSGTGPFTIFAPDNAAFQGLFSSLGVTGIADLTAEQLQPILKHHVLSGNVRSSQLMAGNVTTLNGTVALTLMPAPVLNGNTNVVVADIQGTNGVIHVIDKVLLPQ